MQVTKNFLFDSILVVEKELLLKNVYISIKLSKKKIRTLLTL